MDLVYRNDNGVITLDANARDGGKNTLEFAPSISPNASVQRVEVNGRAAKFDLQKSTQDQHVVVSVPLSTAKNTVRIVTRNDFALVLTPNLPPLGAPSHNLKVVSEIWSSDARSVTYELEGIGGETYKFGVRGTIAKAEGAETSQSNGRTMLTVKFPVASDAGYTRTKVTLNLSR
jgi:hypothetical protein